jgi:hypothetical protein
MISLLLRNIAISRSLLVRGSTKNRSRLHVVDWRLELYDRPSYTCCYTEPMCYHTRSIDFTRATLQTVDRAQWKQEVMGHEELFLARHDYLPEMIYKRELLICRL